MPSQIIQEVPAGTIPAPPPPPSFAPVAVNRKKAFNQGIIQLKILLEMKEKILELGIAEEKQRKQFEEDITEIKEKIAKYEKD